MELILADLETTSKYLSKVTSNLKGPHDKNAEIEKDVVARAKQALEDSQLLNSLVWTPEELKILKMVNLLTIKPIIYLYNISENDLDKDLNLPENSLAICAKLESELADMPDAEAKQLLLDLGIPQSGLDNLITTSYKLLNLITFLTTGEDETRAWTVTAGAKAPQAAGVIHTDFEKGFIRAEVVNWEKLLETGGWNQAKEKGLIRTEGKEYVIQDGDTVYFLFN